MEEEEEAALSQMEEEMIDSLFYKCDTHGDGEVHVYTVIEYLQNCLGNANNEPDLYELSHSLELDSIDGRISLDAYRMAVKQWVRAIRNRSESTSFLDADGPLHRTPDRNFSNSHSDLSVCIETSGIGDGSFHRSENDIGELLQQLEDLKFQNRKFNEEVAQLHCQLEAQEEITANLTTELQGKEREDEQLRKKVKCLQDLIDLRQTVMDENEELKSKMIITQGMKRDLDTRVVCLERENLNLENQVRTYESKWQCACSELEAARRELAQLHATCLEQKNQLLSSQEAKASMEDVISEKNRELGNLKERFDQLMEQNEKLQEEKEDVQVRLAEVNAKLQKYQMKAEQLGLSEESVMTGENGPERSKMSPRLRFSTPLPKNSICMELKDRLNEDKTLPSPFCEKLELSADVNHKLAVLPTYMSAWEFEVSGGSMDDYSLELLKNRKSISPEYSERDLEKKLQSLRDLEKDALQKEIIRLYRSNIDLAERCHKTELREAELREIVNSTNNRCNLEKQKFSQLEESLDSSRFTHEVDLKDLWRLVHNPDEDSTESDCSLSASLEQLKEQIRREIQALRSKLNKKDKALNALRAEKTRLLRFSSKRRESSSPLVDALNIEAVGIRKRLASTVNGKAECQCKKAYYRGNKSDPLVRKHCRNRSKTPLDDGDSEKTELEVSDYEVSDAEIDIVDKLEDTQNMQRKDIPERFRSDSSAESAFRPVRRCEISASHTSGEVRSNKTGDSRLDRSIQSGGDALRTNIDEDFDFIDGVSETGSSKNLESIEYLRNGCRDDKNHAMIRRLSYRRAMEHEKDDSLDEFQELQMDGHIFHHSSAPGQTSALYLTNNTDSMHGVVLSNEYSSNYIPQFSSTPLSQQAVNTESGSEGNKNQHCLLKESQDRRKQKPQTQLFKTSGFNLDRMSPCTSKDLSVLLEEDACGSTSSQSPDLHDQSDHSDQSHQLHCQQTEQSPDSLRFKSDYTNQVHLQGSSNSQSQKGRTSASDYDCSVEVWTLSRSSDSQPNTSCSRDSGHSSSITSFDRNNLSALQKSQEFRRTKSEGSIRSTKDDAEKGSLPSKKGLRLTIEPPERDRDSIDGERSDASGPPSPAICFFKAGDPRMKGPVPPKGKPDEAVCRDQEGSQTQPAGNQSSGSQLTVNQSPVNQPAGNQSMGNKQAESKPETSKPAAVVENGLAKVLTAKTTAESGDGLKPTTVPYLSKIRENNLAKRREYVKQNKMPELSEISEKDNADNNNDSKSPVPPVIKVKGDYLQPPEANGDDIMPSIPDEFLHRLGLTPDGKSSEDLSDQEIESKFTSLSLAFKTDAQTLEKRLEIQERSRDIAEQNVDRELQGLRSGLQVLNQICTDPQVREILMKIQNHIDVLEKATARVSSRAEVFGAIQQEKRMSKAVDIMVAHVENIRRVHEREHAELEEARKLLQDSRSLAPSTIDLPPGSDFLSRRSASVCQNNMLSGKASRRRVSEIALPKVLGGSGAATLHPSASMETFFPEARYSRSIPPSHSMSCLEDEDARSRFQAVIASTTVKSAVANTLRRASLEKQNQVQSATPVPTPQISRDNSADGSGAKQPETQDKDKQKNQEEEAFKKGYEQGLKASLGQDLSSLREQQNRINESLGEIMDSIDSQMEEPKSLKEIMVQRFHEYCPEIKISGWRIRMTMGCFFIVLAVISVIISLFPVSSATLVGYRHYGRPPL